VRDKRAREARSGEWVIPKCERLQHFHVMLLQLTPVELSRILPQKLDRAFSILIFQPGDQPVEA
jgi:hypothetical protein